MGKKEGWWRHWKTFRSEEEEGAEEEEEGEEERGTMACEIER